MHTRVFFIYCSRGWDISGILIKKIKITSDICYIIKKISKHSFSKMFSWMYGVQSYVVSKQFYMRRIPKITYMLKKKNICLSKIILLFFPKILETLISLDYL